MGPEVLTAVNITSGALSICCKPQDGHHCYEWIHSLKAVVKSYLWLHENDIFPIFYIPCILWQFILFLFTVKLILLATVPLVLNELYRGHKKKSHGSILSKARTFRSVLFSCLAILFTQMLTVKTMLSGANSHLFTCAKREYNNKQRACSFHYSHSHHPWKFETS
jgi:hypothetical protein